MASETDQATAPELLTVRSLADQVHGRLRDRILSGELPPGAPMRQDAVAASLGISKIPLREALMRLEQDGLVVSSPNRGFIVSPLSAEEAEEVFALRLEVEPPAVLRGSGAATASDHAAAERQLAALDAAVRADAPDAGLHNRLFHMALVDPGAGRLTRSIVERLHNVADRYVRFHLGQSGRGARAQQEHRAILEAWTRREPDRLDGLVRAHIAATLADLRHELAPAVEEIVG